MIKEKPNIDPTSRFELREVALILGAHKASILRWTRMGKLHCTQRRINNRRVWTGAEILRFWRTEM